MSASVSSTNCRLTLIVILGIPNDDAGTSTPDDSAKVNSPVPVPPNATDPKGAGVIVACGSDTDCE